VDYDRTTTVGIRFGTGVSSAVGCSVGAGKFTTFFTVMVADMYGLQIFTSEEASNVIVRDDDKVA